jgi:uncharacterized spore protein YtfJ
MQEIVALIETITHKIEHIAKTETIIGEPVVVAGKTFFPLIKIRIGFGVTGMSGEGARGSGAALAGQGKLQGGGSGGGIKISPLAMVCMDAERVEVLALPKEKKGVARLFEKIPDLFDKIRQKKEAYDRARARSEGESTEPTEPAN